MSSKIVNISPVMRTCVLIHGGDPRFSKEGCNALPFRLWEYRCETWLEPSDWKKTLGSQVGSKLRSEVVYPLLPANTAATIPG